MEFQLGLLPHFCVSDLRRHGETVKVLGLGGKRVLDYATDSRRPRLASQEQDYLRFDTGARLDATFLNTAAADVLLCPGDRSHYALMHRSGFTDHVAYHPGGEPSSSSRFAERFVALGGGRFGVAERLAAGGEWYGEHVVRWHNYYWRRPVFDRATRQPLPRLLATSGGAAGGGAAGGGAEEEFTLDAPAAAPDVEKLEA